MTPTMVISGWPAIIGYPIISFLTVVSFIVLCVMIYGAINELKTRWKARQKKQRNRIVSVRIHSDEEIEAYKKSLRDNGWIQLGDSSMWSKPAKDT